MIATGNHRYFDSLRDAPRPGSTPLPFCIGFRQIRTEFCRAVEDAGPYIDTRKPPDKLQLTFQHFFISRM